MPGSAFLSVERQTLKIARMRLAVKQEAPAWSSAASGGSNLHIPTVGPEALSTVTGMKAHLAPTIFKTSTWFCGRRTQVSLFVRPLLANLAPSY